MAVAMMNCMTTSGPLGMSRSWANSIPLVALLGFGLDLELREAHGFAVLVLEQRLIIGFEFRKPRLAARRIADEPVVKAIQWRSRAHRFP